MYNDKAIIIQISNYEYFIIAKLFCFHDEVKYDIELLYSNKKEQEKYEKYTSKG